MCDIDDSNLRGASRGIVLVQKSPRYEMVCSSDLGSRQAFGVNRQRHISSTYEKEADIIPTKFLHIEYRSEAFWEWACARRVSPQRSDLCDLCLSQGRLMSCMERPNDVSGVAHLRHQALEHCTSAMIEY